MKTSVPSSLPALIPATTSWEASLVPVPLVSLSPQRLTHAKVRGEGTRWWGSLELIISYTIVFLSEIMCLHLMLSFH